MHITIDRSKYTIVDDTYYHHETAPEVIQVLEDARRIGTRVHIHYGDTTTGQPWGDIATGRIGRSLGPIKIPLVIYNTRSSGGPGLLEHCILKIETASGKLPLYQHPRYNPAV